MSPQRGDIHWISLSARDAKGAEIEKTRPCVILSLSGTNVRRKTVVVVPLTSQQRDAPSMVISVPSAGPDSKPVCDQLLAVDVRRVLERRGSLSLQDMERLEDSIRRVLGL